MSNNKITTRSGKTFDPIEGGHIGTFEARTDTKSGWDIPNHDMWSLSLKEVQKLIDTTIKKGRKLSDNEALQIMGGYVGADNKLAYYHYLLDINADTGASDFDSTGYKVVRDENGNVLHDKNGQALTEATASENDGNGLTSGLEKYNSYIEDLLAQSKSTSDFANRYRQDIYGSINANQAATEATLAQSEIDAYRMLGEQQLELENRIAAQRMSAIKSGVTSAQLASEQLANMFAAQSGASQIAQQMTGNRANMLSTFNQQRAAVETDLYSMLSANQQAAGNMYTQLGAAQAGYSSYANQQALSYKAMLDSYLSNPEAFSNSMGFNKN